MFDVSRDDITSGSIPRALVFLAAPLVAQNLVQFAQLVVDAFWVGQIGENAVAAVGLVFPLTSVLSAFLLLPFVATQIVVSQRVGADDEFGARKVAFNGAILGLTLLIPLSMLAVVGAEPLIEGVVGILRPGSPVGPLAAGYFAMYALGYPFAVVSDVTEGGFVGWGDSRPAFYANVVSVGVNLTLDPLLIWGVGPIQGMGVRGAGLATALGYLAGMLLILYYALGGRDTFTFTRASAVFDLDDWRELVDVGAPSTGQRLAQDAVRLVLVSVVLAAGGAPGLAAYTLGARISAIAWIPANGFSQAAQSIVGQNLGAGNTGRARQTTWTGTGMIVLAMLVVGGAQLLVPEAIATFFVPDITPAALELTVSYLQILAIGYWAIGATYLFRAGFNGARKTKTSMVTSMAQYWGVRLPVALVGVYVLDMGVVAVFWGVTLSNILAALGLAVYYRYSTADGMLERAAEKAAESAG
ncbi:MATE family efflux transporter [Haloarchaeobius sp. TZWWS8]|uniref:MATE family efflux transporter n=1 Tax=Haloarchaeobius sp. TZWWS8 TaxID=3446121 RepID=UPI003EB80F59